MARSRRSKVPFRRRREGKTNYHHRRKLVLSGKNRVVIRRSNKQINLQLVSSGTKGDTTLVSLRTKEVIQLGWQGGTGNIPASYLTGYAFGKKAIAAGISTDELFILDMGLSTKFYGGQIFAALNGIVESGLNIPHNKKVFPSKDRIQGKHISKFAGMISEEDSRFKKYKIKPKDLPKHFDEIKAIIDKTTFT